MAERRMFAKSVVRSDYFLDMPLSTQALYFQFGIEADDDGFVSNPKRLSRMLGSSDDDLRLLIAKKFILWFENGVIVVKDWKINNYIRCDRYKPTKHLEEMALLSTNENGEYTLDNVGVPNGYQMDTQVRLVKASLGKESLGNSLPQKIEKVETKERVFFKNLVHFKKWAVENLEGYTFFTKDIGWREDTKFEIKQGYIYSHFTKDFLNNADALKVWHYLYSRQNELLELVQNAS